MIAEWIDSQNGLHRDLSSNRVMSLGDGGLEERSGREELSSRILGRDFENHFMAFNWRKTSFTDVSSPPLTCNYFHS